MKAAWRTALLVYLMLARPLWADDRCVQVREQPTGNRVALVATLTGCLEATITVTAHLENMRSTAPLPLTIDTAERTSLTLLELSPIDADQPWKYTWHYDWKPGRRQTGTPKPYVYSLPYRSGPFLVVQGPHGAFSHGPGSQDEEGIDWAMPEGTPILAARPGTVIAIRQDCTVGRPDASLRHEYNYVMVLHDDGTVAEYAHLQPNGALVRLGQAVITAQPLGLSGNTGYSSEPHLHFTVFNTVDGTTRLTIPVTFMGPTGKAFAPLEGQRY